MRASSFAFCATFGALPSVAVQANFPSVSCRADTFRSPPEVTASAGFIVLAHGSGDLPVLRGRRERPVLEPCEDVGTPVADPGRSDADELGAVSFVPSDFEELH